MKEGGEIKVLVSLTCLHLRIFDPALTISSLWETMILVMVTCEDDDFMALTLKLKGSIHYQSFGSTW